MSVPTMITKTKKSITPSEMKVTCLSLVSPSRPSPSVCANALAAATAKKRQNAARYAAAERKRRLTAGRIPGWRRGNLTGSDGHLHRGRRDPQGEPQQVRVRPRDACDQARPLSVRVGRLSDGLRLHSGHAVARRRPARRDRVRVGADLPRLRDRGEADRAVPDGGRPGRRRQGARRALLGSELEPPREARGSREAVARRDRALLLGLQGPRAEEGQGRRLVLARGGDRGDQEVARALLG